MRHLPALATCVLCLSSLALAQPLTSAFTFQGQLSSNGVPAAGVFDARFRLFDAPTIGTQLGPTLCVDNITLAPDGTFTAQLDFGAVFYGYQRFLEVAVRPDTGLDCSNQTGFTILAPLHNLTSAPSATFATLAQNALAATDATQLGGQYPTYYTNAGHLLGQLSNNCLFGNYTLALNLTNTSNTFSGTFTGSGAGLTNVPWSGITGAPAAVFLQPSPPPTIQTGSFALSGAGNLGTLSVGTARSAYPLEVGGAGRFGSNGDGDVLRFGSESAFAGLTTEVGASVLNLDLNFHLSNTNTALQGAAVRLDDRPGNLAIQFWVRRAQTTAENSVMNITDDGRVQIGGSPPMPLAAFSSLDRNTSLAVSYGGYFQTSAYHGTALRARALGGGGIGIEAIAQSLSGYGLLAQNNIGSGEAWGVYSEVASTGGVAIEGSAFALSGTTCAIRGLCNSPSGYAGYFEGPGADCLYVGSSGSGRALRINATNAYGIFCVTSNGFAGIESHTGRDAGGNGVYGVADGSTGTNYGVVGQTSSPNGWGVFSNGRSGAAGTKSFRIDHPDDPEHKYLLHYSTESPEVLNAYRGTVTLDERGEALVQLPPYFAKINKDPSYQLTAIGAPMPALHVSIKISDATLAQGAAAAPAEKVPPCTFTISGGAPGGEVCWRVEATRNDRWVRAYGAPIEPDKEVVEDGTYLQPELYNQPAEKGTFHRDPVPAADPPGDR